MTGGPEIDHHLGKLCVQAVLDGKENKIGNKLQPALKLRDHAKGDHLRRVATQALDERLKAIVAAQVVQPNKIASLSDEDLEGYLVHLKGVVWPHATCLTLLRRACLKIKPESLVERAWPLGVESGDFDPGKPTNLTMKGTLEEKVNSYVHVVAVDKLAHLMDTIGSGGELEAIDVAKQELRELTEARNRFIVDKFSLELLWEWGRG